MPTITALTPTAASPVQKTDLTVTGSNFGTDASKVLAFLGNATHPKFYQLSVLTVIYFI